MIKTFNAAAEAACKSVLIFLGLSEGHRVQRAMFALYYAS